MKRFPNIDSSRRRGSALILVVAMLAVLAIFSLTLGFNTRMELTASRNWGNAVQARMAAQSGVALFQGGFAGPNTPLAAKIGETGESKLRPVQLRLEAADLAPALAEAIAAAAKNGPAADEDAALAVTPGESAIAKTFLQDTSAKIDINALVPMRERPRTQPVTSQAEHANRAPSPVYLSEEVLARFIQNALSARGITEVDSAALAHAIAARRYGADRRPGEAGIDDNLNGRGAESLQSSGALRRSAAQAGLRPRIDSDGLDNNLNGQADEATDAVDEPMEAAADPRLAPAGDDQPYGSVGELLALPGMTPQVYEAIAPYLTVFSASHAAFDVSGGGTENTGFPQVDPNTATVEQIFDVLANRFPDAPKPMLAQFAVNVIDRRDADSVPTEWTYGGVTYSGLELTPYINEICSDVASLDDEGDDGQYLELHNPFDKPLDISGWQISGAGPALRLTGSIPAGGYLVITDDFNDQNDPSPELNQPSMGSFYKLFNRVSNGGSRHLIENSAFNLPNESGEVELRDPDGNLVDRFKYSGGTWKGNPKSFQRKDPRVRVATLARATPLEENAGTEEDPQQKAFALKVQQQWQNRPFADALDVMLVSAAFGVAGDALSGETQSQPWAMPELAGGARQLDVRLVDCFRVGAVVPDRTVDPVVATTADARERIEAARRTNRRAGIQRQAAEPFTPPQVNADVVFGRINLNTAAPIVLSSLPGMNQVLLNRIVGARTGRGTGSTREIVQLTAADPLWWREVDPLAAPVWRNLSDFLTDEQIWQNRPLYDRLDAAYPFLGLVTTHSVSVRALTSNRPDKPEDENENRRPSTLMVERILTGDRGALETVRFGFHRRVTAQMGDSDLRASAPITDSSSMMTLAGLSAAYGAAYEEKVADKDAQPEKNRRARDRAAAGASR